MFIVKEHFVDKHITVHDSLEQLKYRGCVRAIALSHGYYVLLIEVTEVAKTDYPLPLGGLVTCSIPNEWEIVKLDATKN